MNKRWVLGALVAGALALAFIVAACDDDGDDGEPTAAGPTATAGAPSAGSHSQILSDVQSSGQLICGVNDGVPGFGFVAPDGTFSGFDIDICRAIAAAVLGDPDAIQFVPLTAQARLTALQTGQIHVLSRNTTWTLSRDVSSGLSYTITLYYDGQGMMVRASDGFTTVDDLANAEICVLQGTTTEQNLADRLPGATAAGFVDNETLQAAFIEERCDGWTSDKSQLASRRSAFPEDDGGPESLTI
ncbi:MAG: transporter substrate-binding domain-containing protein, partial [Chloroflexi bacterium]|nr:transporter substrate-binding domain-containing protein [Chloroflexota bacterium]